MSLPVWFHVFLGDNVTSCLVPCFFWGIMSLPVWSHVLSRGYDVTSYLLPCSFWGIMSLPVWSHVPSGVMITEGMVPEGDDVTSCLVPCSSRGVWYTLPPILTSGGGRYASYWNAFLFKFSIAMCLKSRATYFLFSVCVFAWLAACSLLDRNFIPTYKISSDFKKSQPKTCFMTF